MCHWQILFDAVLQIGPFDLSLEGIDPDDSGCYEVTEKVNTCGCNLPGSKPRQTTLFSLLIIMLH